MYALANEAANTVINASNTGYWSNLTFGDVMAALVVLLVGFMAWSVHKNGNNSGLSKDIGEIKGELKVLPELKAEIAANRAESATAHTLIGTNISELRSETGKNISELRTELGNGISGLRTEVTTLNGETRNEMGEIRKNMREDNKDLRDEIKGNHSETINILLSNKDSNNKGGGGGNQ